MVSTKNKKNIPNARNRILNSAVAVFAEISFDAARVDQIAKRAEVPKSLIYYHFKSKNQILEVILEDFFTAFSDLVREINLKSPIPQKELRKTYYNFLSDNEETVRVAIFESFKSKYKDPPLLKLLDLFIKLTGKYSNNNRHAIELYTNLIPTASFICLGDQFCSKYNIDRDEYIDMFSDILTKVHKTFNKE